MKISIVCVGKIKEKYLRDGINEYLKRLSPFARVDIIEVNEERMDDAPSAAQKEKTLAREGERLLARAPKDSHTFLLDVAGKPISSEELAGKIESLALGGESNLTFIIGGAFGISDEVRKSADERISFSRMTFTHQMVRLLLVEQIYRAFKINRHEKYHW